MNELVIFSGKMKGQRLILPYQREIVVGRDEDCHMRIASSLVSRRHCVLRVDARGIEVRDLNSQNGTYVNDVAITDHYLMQAGDVLRIGASLFQIPLGMPMPAHKPVVDTHKARVLEEETASVFSESEPGTSIPDTTVIKGRSQKSEPSVGADIQQGENPSSSSPAATAKRYPATPRTIKEQAEEIIQKHLNMLRDKQP